MRTARLLTTDLGRTENFVGSLLSREDIKEHDKALAIEQPKSSHANGGSLSFKGDTKPRFSDPPAPPPQQPLPEKPDVARSHAGDSSSSSLKRSNTERPRSVPSISPIRQEPSSQIISLVEALATARKEIDVQSARMRDLEEMLQKERQARETAEELAKRLESQSLDAITNETTKPLLEGSILEDTFEPPSEAIESQEEEKTDSAEDKSVDPKTISASSVLLEQRLVTMMVEMQELKQQMESFKVRAEIAETERDSDRKTLAEMVEKIRMEESARQSSSTEHARSPNSKSKADQHLLNGKTDLIQTGLLLRKTSLEGGSAAGAVDEINPARPGPATLTRPPGGHDPSMYHSAPYASMLGVVLIGMGLMAYLNGWQPPKIER